jgi:hypothetical protein
MPTFDSDLPLPPCLMSSSDHFREAATHVPGARNPPFHSFTRLLAHQRRSAPSSSDLLM